MHGVTAIRSLSAASALSVLLIGGATLSPALRGDGASAEARRPRTAADGGDLRAIARANGWTLAQARANHRSTLAVDSVVEALQAERPGILVGSVLSPDPEGPPTIYIKGPADAVIDGLVA